ncbi:MAG: SulP family inorganic anion transporter [Rhodobacteraceae bacterium]|jgi:SulP family sulfate permease|nr:SulP family inorganic anion transporter [Paracoccaceae bacterium]
MSHSGPARPAGTRPAHPLAPKLLTVLAEGYGLSGLKADLFAGLTVAVVALPLSLAIAIASGVPPDRGLTAAIVGGFLVSLLGGSRFQIGGPAGAFIVLVAATVMRHGLDGLVLATFLSGVMLAALGALRLGVLVKYIPYPVTMGFTAGIGAIILASQLTPFLGLTLAGPEPGPFLDKVPALWTALPTLNVVALVLGVGTLLAIQVLRRVAPRLPGMLIAVAGAAVLTAALGLPVATIGTEFGGLAPGLPAPALPDFDPEMIRAVLPDALAFTLLGAIESLLSAVVADSMSGGRHRPNAELLAQGVANVAVALFQGMPVTGTIARTATNVRAGARGPVAGMVHSAALLLFLMIAAPLAQAIPLAALAGVLVSVAAHMLDPGGQRALWRVSREEAAVLWVTLALTLLVDLTAAIVTGTALGGLVILRRMARITAVASEFLPDHPDPQVRGTLTLRLTGAYFFGSAPLIESVLDRIAERPERLLIDLSAVPLIDQSGARSLAGFVARGLDAGIAVRIEGASAEVRDMLRGAGLRRDAVLVPDPHAEG